MKRCIVFLCVFCVLVLCGCSYREIDRGYLVTAIGFQKENVKSKIYIEAISSSDVNDSPPTRVVLESEGSNFENALTNLNRSLVKPLYFEQLGAAVISGDQTDEGISFLKSIKNINYGIFVVKTDDIDLLFKSQTPSGVLGYDIIGLIKNNGKFKNQLYQNGRLDFYLPLVNFSSDKLTLMEDTL